MGRWLAAPKVAGDSRDLPATAAAADGIGESKRWDTVWIRERVCVVVSCLVSVDTAGTRDVRLWWVSSI